MNTSDLQRAALTKADALGLFHDNPWNLSPRALVLGWIAQESSWNPFAIRYEPAFYARYVPDAIKRNNKTEAYARATSWGLGQMMGQVAREQGFAGRYLAELCDPDLNLNLCFHYLRDDRFARSDETWGGALASYNGGLGGNTEAPYRNQFYVDKVLTQARRFSNSGDPTIRELLRDA